MLWIQSCLSSIVRRKLCPSSPQTAHMTVMSRDVCIAHTKWVYSSRLCLGVVVHPMTLSFADVQIFPLTTTHIHLRHRLLLLLSYPHLLGRKIMIGSAAIYVMGIQKFRTLSYRRMGLKAAALLNFSQLFLFRGQETVVVGCIHHIQLSRKILIPVKP
jgi:hypothetical protein